VEAAEAAYVAALLGDGSTPDRRAVHGSTGALAHLDRLAAIFPEARFVHVLRDGRAVVGSRVRGPGQGSPGDGAPAPSPAEAAARWADEVRVGRRQAVFHASRVLEVRYEDLVQRPESELRRVLGFLAEPWDPSIVPRVAAHPPRPPEGASGPPVVYTSSVDRWRRDLDPNELDQAQTAAGGLLEALGYR
jgi:hypothetical protein